MDILLSKNKFELYSKLMRARSTIKNLRKELESVNVDWSLYLLNLIEKDIDNYHIRINPYPRKIKASHKNKPVIFEINVTDIVAVVSTERTKTIFLTKPQFNIEGDLYKTNKITVNRNKLKLSDLCHEIESIGFYLVQISKNIVINQKFFETNNKNVHLKENLKINGVPKKTTIGSTYLKYFKRHRESYLTEISLHSSLIHYIDKKKAEL